VTQLTRAQVIVEVAGIAATAASIEQRSQALLDVLRRVMPSEAIWLALRDPERGTHAPLATRGHADPLRAYFRTPVAETEVELLGLNRHRPPMLVRDLPVPPGELHAWADHLWPAGFRGGLAAGLFAGDGRLLGFLSLLTDAAERPTDADRDLIAVLTPHIAHAVDRMRTPTAAASIVHDAVGGVVLTRGGEALTLPGLPPHPLLVRGAPALRVAAARLGNGGTHATFLCPDKDSQARTGLVRVTVLGCARPHLDHLLAAVTVSPAGSLRGLTRPQLHLLGLLIEGWPDPRIAAALDTTDNDIADRVGPILAAFNAPDRTTAAVRAEREGRRNRTWSGAPRSTSSTPTTWRCRGGSSPTRSPGPVRRTRSICG
jgi:hypothetical protein